MDRDQALGKIKKCLALAKSSNPHEAAAAMRQAQKLMATFGLSETDASLVDVCEAATKSASNAVVPWEVFLSNMVAEVFGCEKYSSTCRHLTATGGLTKRREYVFVGIGAAPQVASYAYSVLSGQCAKDRLAHIRKQPKNCKPVTKTARGDEFAFGWVCGVRDLVESFAGNERNAQLIEQYMQQHHPDMQTVKAKDRAKGRNVSHNDLSQGIVAGGKAQLHRGVSGLEPKILLARGKA